MADYEKKEEKSEGGLFSTWTLFEIFVAGIILFYFLTMAMAKLGGGNMIAVLIKLKLYGAYLYILSWVPFLKFLSVTVSVLAFVSIIYVSSRLSRVRAVEKAKYLPPKISSSEKVSNVKWERVTTHLKSENPSDWKLAILEADIMLDEMLESMGYRGETMGDKLKGVEKGDFATIDSAWEAHKIRNAIAHEGSDFIINDREARRVIELYRSVFEEFHYV